MPLSTDPESMAFSHYLTYALVTIRHQILCLTNYKVKCNGVDHRSPDIVFDSVYQDSPED